ncbi:MAG TPA: hypothetical protein ENK18_24510 [Deltaproteobacteria bacterium]|nr:hypothetical protein [Deltaproteobacteria bacterium]
MRWGWVLLVSSILGLGGCGSLWREVQARAFSELAVELQDWIDLNDPHRESVQHMIDDGWIAAWEGRAGLFRSIDFEVTFEECASDGMFDESELEILGRKAAGFGARVEGARREALLELKAAMDAEIRAERYKPIRRRGRSADGGGDLANWVLPEDLQDATESAGWKIDRCREDEIEGILFVFCEASKGPIEASIQIDRYPKLDDAVAIASAPQGTAALRQDGDTVLGVRILDTPAAETLRDAILARGDKINELSLGPVRAAIKGGGWQIDNCDAQKEGSVVSVSCEAHQHERKRQALVDLEQHLRDDTDKEERRLVFEGAAHVYQGRSTLSTTVYDKTPAEELADAILR